MCVVPVYTDFLFYFILFLFFIINNGFVLKEKPGTLGGVHEKQYIKQFKH